MQDALGSSTVTFILPVYNGTRYLHEAIESVLRQSIGNWTLLIVDDASQDEPFAVVKRYTQDTRVRYVRNERNMGLYPTLVSAIGMADSAWIGILMQDDRLKPDYLKEMLSLAGKYPDAQAIWATEDMIGTDGEIWRVGSKIRREEFIGPGVGPWLSALRRGCIWTISASFTRRSLFDKMPFRRDLPHCGDYDWLLRAIRQVPFVYFEETLSEIRTHLGQASTGNLRSGRDIEEYYHIVRANLCAHPRDVRPPEALSICFRRSRFAFGRAARCVAKLRFGTAWNMLIHGLKFVMLPAIYSGGKKVA